MTASKGIGRGSVPVRFVSAGDRFGHLAVVVPEVRHIVPSRPKGVRAAVARCDCGEEVTVALDRLLGGHTQSCGCLRKDVPRPRRPRRDDSVWDHPLYGTHHGMMSRCYRPSHVHYQNYGGRGIAVCGRWHDVRLFIEDIEREIGPRPDGLTLDRVNNDGDYQPGNVRWATMSEQRRNQRPGLVGAAAANAARTHCPAGHAYDEDNTYRGPDGARVCRVCRRERNRRYKERLARQAGTGAVAGKGNHGPA